MSRDLSSSPPDVILTLQERIVRLEKVNQALMLQVENLYDWSGDSATLVLRAKELERMVQERTLDLSLATNEAQAANRSKSDFLAVMSHEIRTPMNAVLGMTDLLAQSELTAEQRDLVETVQAAGRSLMGIIDEVLDFSKLEAGKARLDEFDFPLQQVLLEASRLMTGPAVLKGLKLDMTCDEAMPLLHGDPLRIRQVLLNLLSNAVKFTETGTISIAAIVQERMPGYCLIKFQVTDTGIGMEPAVLDKIFQVFTQADASTTRIHGGTGLGLAISQHLIKMMGGVIEVESQPGSGSRFQFALKLPLANAPGPLNASDATPIECRSFKDRGISPRILVAEDNAVNQKLVNAMLMKLGCRVTIVANGAEACRVAAQEKFDLILMDSQMPVMDGLEATRRIRTIPGSAGLLPIVALTANVLPEDRRKCQEAGASDFLSKPLSLVALEGTLMKWVRIAEPSVVI